MADRRKGKVRRAVDFMFVGFFVEQGGDQEGEDVADVIAVLEIMILGLKRERGWKEDCDLCIRSKVDRLSYSAHATICLSAYPVKGRRGAEKEVSYREAMA